jgi:hypothetical protein
VTLHVVQKSSNLVGKFQADFVRIGAKEASFN